MQVRSLFARVRARVMIFVVLEPAESDNFNESETVTETETEVDYKEESLSSREEADPGVGLEEDERLASLGAVAIELAQLEKENNKENSQNSSASSRKNKTTTRENDEIEEVVSVADDAVGDDRDTDLIEEITPEGKGKGKGKKVLSKEEKDILFQLSGDHKLMEGYLRKDPKSIREYRKRRWVRNKDEILKGMMGLRSKGENTMADMLLQVIQRSNEECEERFKYLQHHSMTNGNI